MINITCANSITTVQQDSNLPKTYFNINGKFYTKETTFYIYLANDVYEIPLAKLQVNGSTQATMQDGIDALATILVNAGSSGGGGALAPSVGTIDLSSGSYTVNTPGVYRVSNAWDGTYAINFVADPTTYAGYTITIINADVNNAPLGSGFISEIDGLSVINVPSVSAYIFSAINNQWILISSRTI